MSFGGPGDGLRFLREHEQLLMISISTVLVMAGQGVISPILPLFAKEFGVGAAAVGLTLSSFALARLILNVPLGLLSDRYGRRMLLVSGPIVTGIGMVGSGFSQNIEQLLLWRFIAGAGSALYMTGAMIYLADIFHAREPCAVHRHEPGRVAARCLDRPRDRRAAGRVLRAAGAVLRRRRQRPAGRRLRLLAAPRDAARLASPNAAARTATQAARPASARGWA